MTDAAEGHGAFTVLIVEDDNAVKSLIATALKVQGYRLLEAGTGGAALLEATTKNPDVIILDLGLPDADGIDLIRQVRTWSHTPIIVVSARTEDADKVAALDAGADDYLIKPFSVEELLARLRVATRRLAADSGTDRDGPVYENGDLRIDYAARTVTLAGEEVHLTPIEYKLLALLARNTGKVLTHNAILKEVWGNALASDLPSLRVFMPPCARRSSATRPTPPTSRPTWASATACCGSEHLSPVEAQGGACRRSVSERALVRRPRFQQPVELLGRHGA